MLEQRLADALRDAAVDLAVDDQRIDGAPDIVDGGVADDLDHAGVGIDLDLADVGAVGKRRLATVSSHCAASGPRRSSGRSVRSERRARDLEQADRVVGALHGEAAVLELDVGGRGLQQMLGDARALLDDVVGGFLDDDAAEPHAAAGMRAAADRDAVGVAGDEAHAVDRHAEPFGDQLGEARLVALALRHGADHQLDDAVGLHRDLGRSRGTPVAVST